MIDPGHGGTDHGAQVQASSARLTEKDVTLQLAKQVAFELTRRGIRVALTRSKDEDVSLTERTAIANRLKADAFISIHMNSSQAGPEGEAEGVETYILNNSTDSSSKRLADLENAVLQDSQARGVSGDVALIVKDLMLDANLGESQRLACSVQSQLVNATSTQSTRYRNRGVKQALFYVLLGADMPSILVEAGFLNNVRDRLIASSDAGQKRMAIALAQAVQEFRYGMGRVQNNNVLSRCKIREHLLSPRKTVRQTAQNTIIH